jgi:putative endonuclease
MNNRELGSKGEDTVVEYLKKKGYLVIEKNFRTRMFEIDIIAKTGNIICFIEVKSRKTSKYGLPREAVTRKKQNQIIKGAMTYIKYKKLKTFVYRFDVVEVFLNEGKINHIENAFWV